MRRYQSVVVCLLLLAKVPLAFAAITDCSAPMPIVIDIPDKGIPSNLPLGQPIPGASRPFSFTVTCNVSFAGTDKWRMSPTDGRYGSTAYPQVYTYGNMASNGLGFRVLDGAGVPMTNTPVGSVGAFAIAPATATTNIAGTFELVRIGVTAATGQQAIKFHFHVPNKQYANKSEAQSLLTFNYQVSRPKVPTCSVSTSSLSVDLPPVGKSSFKGQGTASAAKAFNIGLQCEANVQAVLTFSDLAKPDNRGDSLSLNAGSTAQGVGVRILSQGQPIRLSPAGQSNGSELPVATSSAAQPVTVPLVAQILQTEPVVVPGTLSATTAFTLTYP